MNGPLTPPAVTSQSHLQTPFFSINLRTRLNSAGVNGHHLAQLALVPWKMTPTMVTTDFRDAGVQLAGMSPLPLQAHRSEDNDADPTPFVAEMSHVYVPFSQQRADGLFTH